MDLPATSTLTRVSRFFRRPRQSAGNVYCAKLETLQGTFYKIGFTTKPTLHERMAYNGQGNEKLIKQVLLFSYHANAWDIEQTLLDHFSKHRAFKKGNAPSKPLYKNGQSELFATDVLGLDEPLYLSRAFTTQTSIVDAEQARYGCFAALIGLALAPFTLGISLFFIWAGIVEFFSATSDKTNEEELVARERPKHPESIKIIVDELAKLTASTQT